MQKSADLLGGNCCLCRKVQTCLEEAVAYAGE